MRGLERRGKAWPAGRREVKQLWTSQPSQMGLCGEQAGGHYLRRKTEEAVEFRVPQQTTPIPKGQKWQALKGTVLWWQHVLEG